MDLIDFTNYIPHVVVGAVILCIIFVYLTQGVVSVFENWIEKKTGKQIKIFDHKKIWLSFFWCAVLTFVLVISGFIEKEQALFYGFAIMGLSTFFYETVLKRFGMLEGKE